VSRATCINGKNQKPPGLEFILISYAKCCRKEQPGEAVGVILVMVVKDLCL